MERKTDMVNEREFQFELNLDSCLLDIAIDTQIRGNIKILKR